MKGDVSSSLKKKSKYYFDEDAATKVQKFFSKVLTHVKGHLAGSPLILEPWQSTIIENVFGWKRESDGTRRYRVVYIEVPRKNGKSTLAAGIALVLLHIDGEPGAEIYSAAADREQARIVFSVASSMVTSSPLLSKRSEVLRNAIIAPKSNSSYKAISAEAYTKHGLNAHGVLFDELHAQPNRDLWDVLKTSQGSRRQPLLVAITTAGFDKHSICWEQHEHARKTIEDPEYDESLYPVIFSASDKDDWQAEETWQKANPNFGVSISGQYLREECDTASKTPAYENTFKRLFLNMWTEQDVRWMPMDAWDLCQQNINADDLAGEECVAGLDISSVNDLSALILYFSAKKVVLPFYFVPQDGARLRGLRDRVPYPEWIRAGFIEATPGNVVDQDRIRKRIGELGEKFKFIEIAIDRWNSTQLQSQLLGDGFNVVQFGQGYMSMSDPTKRLLGMVLNKSVTLPINPVLRWNASNVVVEQDAAGNLKPSKAKSGEKIDGMVALIMAVGRADAQTGASEDSVYEERGVLTI
jgi:phage terminase large subunit-like protein